MTLREATIADVDQLVELGLRFRRSTGYAAFIAENPDQIRRTLTCLITQEDGVIFVTEDRAGLVTGLIGMILAVHHFSGELIAGEVVFYVQPESRGPGWRLKRQAEQWARNQGALIVQMVAPIGSAVGVLYERDGYAPMETAWQKRLTAKDAAA